MKELRGRRLDGGSVGPLAVAHFASPADHGECKRLHRRFGTTYYFATRRLPATIRRRIHALYGFVRVPDEWVDNPKGASPAVQMQNLRSYRNEFLRGMDGVVPSRPVLRAFCDVAREVSLPLDEPLRFLDAMEQDVFVSRYQTYEELKVYMRGSATSVGLMMCILMDVDCDDVLRSSASALGEAMQLTNFLRDVGEDIRRGRIYIPKEDMNRFLGSETSIMREEVTHETIDLLRFEIDRARTLYAEADRGIPLLPPTVRPAVRLARVLYSRILDRIERRGYDVFTGRARTSAAEKLITAFKLMAGNA